MRNYTDTTREYTTIKYDSGWVYEVEVDVTKVEIRRGTYSSMAEDPDEYYGVYAYHAEVIGAEFYNENDDEPSVWVDVEDLPKSIVEEAAAAFEDQ